MKTSWKTNNILPNNGDVVQVAVKNDATTLVYPYVAYEFFDKLFFPVIPTLGLSPVEVCDVAYWQHWQTVPTVCAEAML